jgi:hypothetical protein
MAIVMNDRIAGAVVERGVPGMMRAVRPAMVAMNTLSLSPWQILNQALLQGSLSQPGEPHPEDERCLLSRARAVAVTDSLARIDLIYERVPLTTYQEDEVVVPIRTMNLPGTRQQIMASYSGEGWPGAALKRACTITYRCPMRKLVVGKALFGFSLSTLVPDTAKAAVGCVNDRPWMGLEKGFWLADGLRTQAIEPDDNFEFALCFYVYATFFSQVRHDWSYWQFLQLPNGHYVKVEAGDISAALTAGYDLNAPSYRGDNSAITQGKGFAVAYPYPAVNFYEIFGIQ